MTDEEYELLKEELIRSLESVSNIMDIDDGLTIDKMIEYIDKLIDVGEGRISYEEFIRLTKIIKPHEH